MPRADVARRRAGVTTRQLDAIAEDAHPGPGAVSVVHGVPRLPRDDLRLGQRRDRARHPRGPVLAGRRPVSIDCGCDRRRLARRRGAISVARRAGRRRAARADGVCEGRCGAGSRRPGWAAGVSDISHAVESYVRARGTYGIVEDYVGHGIGSAMHMAPHVPNYGPPGRGPGWSRGWRSPSSRCSRWAASTPGMLDDDWTVVTEDGSWAAHIEHTFTLTPPAGGC